MAPEPNSSESSSSEFFQSRIPSLTKLNLQIYQSIFLQCPAHNSHNSRINSLKTFRNSQPLLPSFVLLRPSFGSASITSGTEWLQRKKVCSSSLNLPPCLLPRSTSRAKKDTMLGACIALCTSSIAEADRKYFNCHRNTNTGPPDFITLCARPIGV